MGIKDLDNSVMDTSMPPRLVESASFETDRTGFMTNDEAHPSELVGSGKVNQEVNMKKLREAIPPHCFKPNMFWSFFYLGRDFTYTAILILSLRYALARPEVQASRLLYYGVVNIYGFCQGLVWSGLWVIAHDAGHSGFSRYPILNDIVGFILHSSLLAPYFSWKSTHRRHHIYANHMEKDHNYVPLLGPEYAEKIGVALEHIDDVGQDSPLWLFIRILLQQLIGWNWYILSNITAPKTSTVKQNLPAWRYSHFDPWGGLFRSNEATSILLSDLGCGMTLLALYLLARHLGSFEPVFWLYIVPWTWVNHWVVMITFLHHTHPSVPKYPAESWTFIRGATATIDRDFGIIGTHFFHHISSNHVTHHLFSSIPHYYLPEASKAIVPLLGQHYHGRGTFTYRDLEVAFSECQFVEGDVRKDREFGLLAEKGDEAANRALWYRKGVSPPPEFQRRTSAAKTEGL